MPKNIVKINQSDDDKDNKKNAKPFLGDLNAKHIKQFKIENIHRLSERVFEQFNSPEKQILNKINI